LIERKELLDGERDQANTLSKWLLTLNSGSLLFSWTLFKDALELGHDYAKFALLSSWFLLVAALLSGLLSLYVSQKAYEHFREILDAAVLKSVESKVTHQPYAVISASAC